MKKHDLYNQITEKIISNLETAGSWKKLWSMPGPISINGHSYRGVNRLILASDKYESPVYGTFDQIRHNGGVVKKGEKSTIVVFWKKLSSVDTVTKEVKTSYMLRYYYVFNVEQATFDDKGKQHIASLAATTMSSLDLYEIPSAEYLINSIQDGPRIEYSSKEDRAFYSPSMDFISVPKVKFFKSVPEFYSTLFHELIHSTGHSSRLNRFANNTPTFGSDDYSKEELVAELGASFLCAICNIDNDLVNASAYIKSWSSKLKEHTSWIIWAASRAEAATDYILQFNDVKAIA